jgi:hypothetical protein
MGEQSRGEMDNPMAKYTMGKETWYLDTETGSTGELSRTIE